MKIWIIVISLVLLHEGICEGKAIVSFFLAMCEPLMIEYGDY